MDSARTSNPTAQRWFGGGGAAASLFGILASSCCVLPIVALNLGLAGIAAVLIPWLAAGRVPMLVLAGTLLALAWQRHWRCRRSAAGVSCASPRSRPIGLVLASAVWLLALSWSSWVEPQLLRSLR